MTLDYIKEADALGKGDIAAKHRLFQALALNSFLVR